MQLQIRDEPRRPNKAVFFCKVLRGKRRAFVNIALQYGKRREFAENLEPA
jgi:hypothetical protein